MKTFLITTPQPAFSKDLFDMLESKYQGLNMQTASNNGEMASMLKNNIYDLAIVNSDRDAFDLSNEIIAAGLSVPIIVYSETSYIPLIRKLYGAGISGVLNVGDGDREILKAITDVLAKRIYMSETLKQKLLYFTAIADECADQEQDESPIFPSNTFDANNDEQNLSCTYLGHFIPVFTHCLN